MRTLESDVRELTFAEIEMVSGGGWWSSLVEMAKGFGYAVMETLQDAAQWLADHGVTVGEGQNENGEWGYVDL